MVILWGAGEGPVKPHPQNCCRHRGDRERELECLLHVQPLSSQLHVHSDLNTLLPQELLTCFTLLHPAQTEPLQPVNEPSHIYTIARTSSQTLPIICFLPVYSYSQVFFCFEQCCTTYYYLHNTVHSRPCTKTLFFFLRASGIHFLQCLGRYINRYFFLLVYNKHVDKYKTGQSLHFSL